MAYDSQGNPRSGFGRLRAAEASFKAKSSGGPPKGKTPPEKGEPAEKGGGHEPSGVENMHAHSHKGGEHDVSHMPIHDVVGEHGTADKIFSEHDGDGHHVHSVHGMKHHHTDHDTEKEAHEHMGHALGLGGEAETEGPKPDETPDEAEDTGSEAPGSIPGLTS